MSAGRKIATAVIFAGRATATIHFTKITGAKFLRQITCTKMNSQTAMSLPTLSIGSDTPV